MTTATHHAPTPTLPPFNPLLIIDRIDLMGESAIGAGRPFVNVEHLSGSQIKSLSRCGTAYYFERALKIPTAKGSSLIKGSAVHEGIAAGLLWKRAQFAAGNTTLDAETFYEIASAAALALLKKELSPEKKGDPAPVIAWDRRWQKGPLDNPETLERDVCNALHLFAKEQYPRWTPVRVESGYLIYWKDRDTLPLLGYTDLVFRDEVTGRLGILDWKTSTKIKTRNDLALDNALVGYAHGAQVELNEPIATLSYGCIVFNAPEKGSTDARVRIEIISLPFHAPRLLRLYSKCRSATNTRHSGEYSIPDDTQTCPTCAFRFACSELLGPLDPTLMDFSEENAEGGDTPALTEAPAPPIAA